MKKNIVYILIIIGTGFILAGLAWVSLVHKLVSPSPRTSPRQITSLHSFDLLWKESVLFPHVLVEIEQGGHDGSFIDVVDNHVIVIMGMKSNLFSINNYLVSFDSRTGNMDWKTSLTLDPLSIGSNTTDIVVIREDGNPPASDCNSYIAYCNAIYITSYDALSGAENWSVTYQNMERVSSLDVNDDLVEIVILASDSSVIRMKLDVSTGNEISTSHTSQRGPQPVLDQYQLTIISRHLNHDDIIGNYAEDDDYIFYATQKDNTLWAINKESRRIEGSITFDNALDNFMSAPYIILRGNTVIVYLADSNQFFTFHFQPDSTN